MKKRVVIMGTQGVPAQYGGFETLVENMIGENASPDVEYTVICSSWDYKERCQYYKGARLEYVPLHANGVQSILYDMLSLCRILGKGYDVALVLGISGGLALPLFRLFYRGRLVVNIDGLEHRREKWGRFARWFLRFSEHMAVCAADVVVADNKGIADYVQQTYGVQARLIAYGGDHALRPVSHEQQMAHLSARGLAPRRYALAVCRIEPENNCHKILAAAASSGLPLVFVGNWQHSSYGQQLFNSYKEIPHIHLANAIYDLDELNSWRANCRFYIHGHSAGGTNPSLVEAMHFGVPIFAFDVVYNRETTGGKALYWKSSDELALLLEQPRERFVAHAEAMANIARRQYVWKRIARQYEACYKPEL